MNPASTPTTPTNLDTEISAHNAAIDSKREVKLLRRFLKSRGFDPAIPIDAAKLETLTRQFLKIKE